MNWKSFFIGAAAGAATLAVVEFIVVWIVADHAVHQLIMGL